MNLWFRKVLAWLSKRRKLVALVSALGLLAVLQAFQVFYPGGRLLPFTTVEGQYLGAVEKSQAAKQLDQLYNDQPIEVRLGTDEASVLEPTFQEIGTTSTNKNRLEDATYPWYLRLVPTSIFWAGNIIDYSQPDVKRSQDTLNEYMAEAEGSCRVKPKPASLKASGDNLELVPARPGLLCDSEDLKASLAAAEPNITRDKVVVEVDAEQLQPLVSNETAESLAEQIERNTSGGVPMLVEGETIVIPKATVLKWLDFEATDSGELGVAVNRKRARGFLDQNVSPKVSIPAGVSQVTTRDFVEIERKDGKPGRALDVAATLEQVRQVVVGEGSNSQAVTVQVPPRVEYTRTYSPTDRGLNALLQNYANDNKGTYGIALVELSGKRRRAEFNADKQFVTASTYKLFVAYSVLKRVESGEYSWSDQVVGGRSLSVCFEDMIAKSDNPCPEALIERVGFQPLTNDANSLGLKGTTFLKGDRPLTTASDLTTFLATLQSGQMLKSDSRERLIGAMQRNIFRQGIPAGSSGSVADKVGFLDNLLHDTAIVKDAHGTYVLTVLTEDSSWQAIADLTREIEKLRAS